MSTPQTTPDATLASKPTPSIAASDAVMHIHSTTLINTPAQQVWDTLIDTSTWPSWNTFVPKVTIRDQPDTNPASETDAVSPILRKGTRMTFHVQMNPAAPNPRAQEVPLKVTEFEAPDATRKTPGRIVWVGDTEAAGSLPGFLLTAERVHEVEEVAEGVTEVRNWEAQVGYLVYVVRWMYGAQLKKNFETWVGDLKGFVEGVSS